MEYLIKYNAEDKFIGVDEASGYPYITSNIKCARIWKDKTTIENYWKIFRNYYPEYEILELF